MQCLRRRRETPLPKKRGKRKEQTRNPYSTIGGKRIAKEILEERKKGYLFDLYMTIQKKRKGARKEKRQGRNEHYDYAIMR